MRNLFGVTLTIVVCIAFANLTLPLQADINPNDGMTLGNLKAKELT